MERTISKVISGVIPKWRSLPINSAGFIKQNLYVATFRKSYCIFLKKSGNCTSWNASCKIDFRNSFKYASSDSVLPSHHKVRLPALSPTMEKGTIVSWEKKERDKLNEGDLLAEIETDKATMGFETPEEGYLAKILVPAGTKDVPLGRLLCIIVSNEGDIASFDNYVDSNESETVKPPPPPPPMSVKGPTSQSSLSSPPINTGVSSPQMDSCLHSDKTKHTFFISPLAKRVAAERGIDLSVVKGTGPGGRIRIKDVESYKSLEIHRSVEFSSSYSDVPITSMRQVISKRLMHSKQTIPHYYLSMNVNMKKVLEVRRKLNEVLCKEGIKLSINDFIIKATALACKKIPESNSSWQEEFIRQYDRVDINFAVSTDGGLIAPIIFDADRKGLSTISRETKALVLKTREGGLKPEEFQGGTFTVSNLGMFGIKNFSAVINPPQACILAVGAIEEAFVSDDQEFKSKTSMVMDVTLSCDHRVIDGAVGAQWLLYFRQLLETPESMLL